MLVQISTSLPLHMIEVLQATMNRVLIFFLGTTLSVTVEGNFVMSGNAALGGNLDQTVSNTVVTSQLGRRLNELALQESSQPSIEDN